MRNSILLILIVVSLQAFGQEERFTFGLNSGVNVSILMDETTNSSSFLGYSLGAKGRWNLNTNWGMKNKGAADWFLESGVAYLYQGFDYSINSLVLRRPQHQVQVPLHLLAKVSNNRLPRTMRKKGISLVGRFGGVFGFQKKEMHRQEHTVSGEVWNEEVATKPFSFWLSGGLGLEREFEKSLIGVALSINGGLLTSGSGVVRGSSIGTVKYDYNPSYFSIDTYLLLKKTKRQKDTRPSL